MSPRLDALVLHVSPLVIPIFSNVCSSCFSNPPQLFPSSSPPTAHNPPTTITQFCPGPHTAQLFNFLTEVYPPLAIILFSHPHFLPHTPLPHASKSTSNSHLWVNDDCNNLQVIKHLAILPKKSGAKVAHKCAFVSNFAFLGYHWDSKLLEVQYSGSPIEFWSIGHHTHHDANSWCYHPSFSKKPHFWLVHVQTLVYHWYISPHFLVQRIAIDVLRDVDHM